MRDQADQWLRQNLHGEVLRLADIPQLRKNGRQIHVAVTRSPIRDERGQVVAVSLIARDITAQRRHEQMFRQTFESAPAAILMSDRAGNIRMANRRVTELFGYSAEALAGMNVEELFPLRFHEQSVLRRMAYFDERPGNPDTERELFGRRRDGSEFPVEVSLSVVETDDDTWLLTIVGDMTDRRLATEALREEIRRREQFLAMLSHELRNPLSAVRSAVWLLDRDHEEHREKADALAIIDRQTRQMSRLLDDLLDVARVMQDRIVLKLERVDLRSVIAGAAEAVQPMSAGQGVVIERDVGPHPVCVDADEARMEQVVTNLLANAVKYSDAGSRVRVILDSNLDSAIIRVRDRGIGIDSEFLPRVFDLFLQADSTLDRSQGGMGVGLTLVKRLVELHGGSISAHSEGIGHGSEFVVTLPLARTSPVPRPAHPRPAPLSGRTVRHLLVIEDQDDNRKLLKSLLELEGFEVDAASNGREGLEMIAERLPDVALIDIGLPRMDGYEVARRVREQFGRDLVLVALTGYGQPSDVAAAHEAGFDFHMVKPFHVDKLLALLGMQPARSR
jgi:two-component system CheB/CheR fusion protein